MRVVVGMGHALWFFATWRISAVLPPPRRLVFLVLIVALPGAYATKVFAYAEGFPTARIIAEALTLAALAAALERRPFLAGILMLMAATQHPLMAAGGGFLLALWWGLASVRHLAAATVALGLVLGLVFATTGLLERLLVPMDPLWLALTEGRNPYVFVSNWKLQNLNLFILDLCALGTGWHVHRDSRLGRLFLAGLLLGGLAFMAALIGGEWLHSQLLIQIQPMRAFWLVKWLALLAFASLLSSSAGSWVPLLLATGWLTQDNLGGLMGLAAVTLSSQEARKIHLPKLAWLLPLISSLSWVYARYFDNDQFWLLAVLMDLDKGSALSGISESVAAMVMFVYKDGVALAGVLSACALFLVWNRNEAIVSSRVLKRFLPVFSIAIFSIGILLFQTSVEKKQHFFEETGQQDLPYPFLSLVPPDSVVYWQDRVVNAWFLLGRRNYYSKTQSAGALFSRDATLEMKRRADRLASLGVMDAVWDFEGRLPEPRSGPQVREGLISLCKDEPIDFVVLKHGFADLQVAQWLQMKSRTNWWLYDCQQIRRQQRGEP